ncbi:unnamed protein product [Rotaria sordida]|uniref:CCR4-NOT transcription complex subunit 4 n=1 Tax=Rotaria sordida TaxID=392033 RepID=A0A818PK56_9BILA|nr:unnamed protein product [Rotaria sordida]CAF3620136.1 unnamed protein product [Rotaria sordida]
MDSDQESSECPLCLEVLEADDLNFFPCTCCYQICRFCWHRIRTDENGLCPACRKPYSENPAQFKPLTDEEIQQVKRDRKLKESHKKPKITESRKHLANLRVVQRNLVFVNGLPSRLADTELLRRNDYFGKYGKIVKLVTSPAHNGQLNSICVYITYSRSEEALRAIQALCNYHVDGRTLKATLGTTKYCSRYLKGASCQKADCLYLHEPGDPLASFTKEQMQQGLHLEYERKLMEQFTNKSISGQSNTTPKTGRTMANGKKTDSTQRRKNPTQTTSLIPTTNSAISTNGNSDLESGDEIHHHTLNGYNSETFTRTNTINVDSDTTSTSSQTSSEHDPQVTSLTIQTTQTCNTSPTTTNWPDERTSFFATNNLASSQQPPPPTTTTKSLSQISPSINVPVTTMLSSPNNNNLLTESNNNNNNNTVKNFDQLPEYKLFSSNIPSIHNLLFGNNENSQQSQRPLINGIDHDVREIEKRLMENGLNNGDTSYSQTQENDELGFDPCSLFMSALASDIEDERRPLPSTIVHRPITNSYNYSSQYTPTTNPSIGQINTNWLLQQQQPQQYQQYHDQQAIIHSNGTTPQKQQQQQQRYPISFNGSSPRQVWNGNQQQYAPQISTRLDFTNQIQQRLPPTQSSSQYSQSINNNNNNNNNTYSSNSTVTTNNLSNDRWINLPWTDPAIISFGNKLDTTSSQWSTTTQSQGSSTLSSSGNNLMSTTRWSQQQPSTQSQTHMITNGIYSPYSTTSGVDNGNRS